MLKRKLLRDLWQGRTQFVSIFLMAFLGLAIFAGIDAESNGIGLSTAAYYRTTNVADSWVVGNGFTEEEVRKLIALPQIDTVDRKIVIQGKAKTSDGGEFDMELNFLESMHCSYPYLIVGESFAPEKKGIWLEEAFARVRGYHVGDRIRLKYENVEFTEEVKGIIIHPEYIFYTLESDSMMPDYGNYGYGFLSKTAFPTQEQLSYNRLVIKQNQEKMADMDALTFKELVKATLDRDELVVLDQSQNEGIDSIANEKSQHAAMGIIFSAVFLLIAVMGIVTTMTRMTSNQRIQIGTLKALGFSKARITRHYVSYGAVISAVGSILGSACGKLLLPSLFLPTMSAYYILPEWKTGVSEQSYVAIILAIVVSSLVSFLSCRRELRDMPAITLKPAVPKNLRRGFLEKSSLWRSLRFSTQWNVRDILRNRARSIMGITGVAGCTMLLVCAFGCRDSFDEMVVWQYGQLNTAQNKIVFSQSLSNLKKREYSQQFKGQLLQEGSCEFRTDNKVKTGNITVIGSGNYVHYQDYDGNEVAPPAKGLAMSYKLAEVLGLQEGDFVEWHIVGEKNWEKSRITMLYRTPVGQGITLSKEEYESYHYTFAPTSLDTNMSVPDYIRDSDEISGVISLEQLKKDLDENMEMMNLMVGILILAAVLLGIIVLYNMGVLSFLEKTREVATLKVLGFSSGRIRKILRQQNNWITVIGIVFGLFMGYQLLDGIMQTLTDDQDMPTVIYTLSYLYSIIGTWIVSTGVNTVLSGKVKTICMVDALKGIE